MDEATWRKPPADGSRELAEALLNIESGFTQVMNGILRIQGMVHRLASVVDAPANLEAAPPPSARLQVVPAHSDPQQTTDSRPGDVAPASEEPRQEEPGKAKQPKPDDSDQFALQLQSKFNAADLVRKVEDRLRGLRDQAVDAEAGGGRAAEPSNPAMDDPGAK